jgi:hypothetical protein
MVQLAKQMEEVRHHGLMSLNFLRRIQLFVENVIKSALQDRINHCEHLARWAFSLEPGRFSH